MSRLKKLLTSYTAVPPTMGRKEAPKRDPVWLARELRRVSDNNRLYFTFCFASIVLLLVTMGAIAIFFLNSPGMITLVFSALGLSVSGLTVQMANLWKQKVAADLLIVVTSVANDEQLSGIIAKLLEKL